ncbi:MAG: YiiX family permuted papain-like enzyme [Flavobacteriales bacterium]
MKKLTLIAIASIAVFLIGTVLAKGERKTCLSEKIHYSERKAETELQFGDLVFQSSKSGQSAAIQLATGSKYSHVGMIYEKKGDEWLVLEAVQPVKLTPLSEWVTHGDDNLYSVKRLKTADSSLTSEVELQMKTEAVTNIGKNYDIYFDWSDKEIYCSELVWKLYHSALNVELGELRPLSDFDLTHPIVKEIMTRRYGKDIPLESLMISPGDMFNSDLLETIKPL